MKLALKTTRTNAELYLQMESEAHLLFDSVNPAAIRSLFEEGFLETKTNPAKNVETLREILDLALKAETTHTLFQSVRFDLIPSSWNAIPGFSDLHAEVKNEIVIAGKELVALPRYWDGMVMRTSCEGGTITDEGEPCDPDDDDFDGESDKWNGLTFVPA